MPSPFTWAALFAPAPRLSTPSTKITSSSTLAGTAGLCWTTSLWSASHLWTTAAPSVPLSCPAWNPTTLPTQTTRLSLPAGAAPQTPPAVLPLTCSTLTWRSSRTLFASVPTELPSAHPTSVCPPQQLSPPATVTLAAHWFWLPTRFKSVWLPSARLPVARRTTQLPSLVWPATWNGSRNTLASTTKFVSFAIK